MNRVVQKNKSTCIKCGKESPFGNSKFMREVELPCMRPNGNKTDEFLSTGRYTLCENCFEDYSAAVFAHFAKIEEDNTDSITVTM